MSLKSSIEQSEIFRKLEQLERVIMSILKIKLFGIKLYLKCSKIVPQYFNR